MEVFSLCSAYEWFSDFCWSLVLSNNRSGFGFALFFINIFHYLVHLVIFWFILIILFLTLESNTEPSCLFELLLSNGESVSFF